MIQEAIKQLWRAKTRGEATIALDKMERCTGEQWEALGAIEFMTLEHLIRVKGALAA